MKHISKRDIIKAVATQWREQCKNHSTNEHKIIVGVKLAALNTDTCTAEDVNAIMGNTSWTELKCDECKQDVDDVIQLGDEPGYDSATVCVCYECLTKAIHT